MRLQCLRIPSLLIDISRVFLLSTLVLLVATPAIAQRDATIAGKVVDIEGKPIANAVITIHSPSKGTTRTLRTDQSGDYRARGFSIGVYVVRVEAEGLATQEQEIKLNFGMNTVDATLGPASVKPKVDFDTLNTLYRSGVAAFQAEDWTTAEASMIGLLDGMGELTGEEATVMRKSAYEVLGRAYQEQGDFEAAIGAYDKLLAIDAQSLPAALGAAQTHQRANEFDKALSYARKVVELAPDGADMQAYAGALLLEGNEVEEAVAALERAIELQPEFPQARKTLGYAYLRTQEYAKALELLKSYLEQDPDAPDKADVQVMIEGLEDQIRQ